MSTVNVKSAKSMSISQLFLGLVDDHSHAYVYRGEVKNRRDADPQAFQKVLEVMDSEARSAQPPKRQFKPLDEWIKEQDNKPCDPHPVGPLMKEMLNDPSWNFKDGGLRNESGNVQDFLANEDLWPLSEAYMSVEQRRFWRSIKKAYRAYKAREFSC